MLTAGAGLDRLDGPFTERIADVKGGYAAAQRSQTLDVRDAFGTHNPSDQGRPGESCQPSPEHPSALSPVYTLVPAIHVFDAPKSNARHKAGHDETAVMALGFRPDVA